MIAIAYEMEALLPLFVDSAMAGLILPTEHAANFMGMTADAKELIKETLGVESSYFLSVTDAIRRGEEGFVGGPSYASVQEVSQIVRRAHGAVSRKPSSIDATPIFYDSATELDDLAASLEKWAIFIEKMNGLADEDNETQVAVSALVLEGRAFIEERLGQNSAFARGLDPVLLNRSGYQRNPNADDLARYVLSMHGAARQIRRKAAETAPAPNIAGNYVSLELIAQLRENNDGNFDLTRLAEFCRELNVTAGGRANMATTMLVRAILDHVPPALGCASFSEVVSNYAGSKSFKDHMRHLDSSSRKIADGSLHTRIRRRESVPTDIEVDFRSAIGELVREVLRVARDGPKA